jgi:hypothetical protein
MFEFASPFADKIVLEELTTNGSPVTIKLYNTYSSEDPNTIIQNITEIRDIFLVGSSSEASIAPVFRISRYRNESVRITIIFRSWGSYPSTDNITMGPSIFLVLALPLAWSMYKNWGYRLDRRGYVILFLIILSGILIAPVLVYTYNGGSALLRQDEVQDVRTFSFMLNEAHSLGLLNLIQTEHLFQSL